MTKTFSLGDLRTWCAENCKQQWWEYPSNKSNYTENTLFYYYIKYSPGFRKISFDSYDDMIAVYLVFADAGLKKTEDDVMADLLGMLVNWHP